MHVVIRALVDGRGPTKMCVHELTVSDRVRDVADRPDGATDLMAKMGIGRLPVLGIVSVAGLTIDAPGRWPKTPCSKGRRGLRRDPHRPQRP